MCQVIFQLSLEQMKLKIHGNLGAANSNPELLVLINNCNYTLFTKLPWLGRETAKGPFGCRVKLLPSTTHSGGFTLSL